MDLKLCISTRCYKVELQVKALEKVCTDLVTGAKAKAATKGFLGFGVGLFA